MKDFNQFRFLVPPTLFLASLLSGLAIDTGLRGLLRDVCEKHGAVLIASLAASSIPIALLLEMAMFWALHTFFSSPPGHGLHTVARQRIWAILRPEPDPDIREYRGVALRKWAPDLAGSDRRELERIVGTADFDRKIHRTDALTFWHHAVIAHQHHELYEYTLRVWTRFTSAATSSIALCVAPVLALGAIVFYTWLGPDSRIAAPVQWKLGGAWVLANAVVAWSLYRRARSAWYLNMRLFNFALRIPDPESTDDSLIDRLRAKWS